MIQLIGQLQVVVFDVLADNIQPIVDGRIDLQIAVQCGELLATVHNETAGVPEIKKMFRETKAFEQLRIEPHYNYIVKAFPDLKKAIGARSQMIFE